MMSNSTLISIMPMLAHPCRKLDPVESQGTACLRAGKRSPGIREGVHPDSNQATP